MLPGNKNCCAFSVDMLWGKCGNSFFTNNTDSVVKYFPIWCKFIWCKFVWCKFVWCKFVWCKFIWCKFV